MPLFETGAFDKIGVKFGGSSALYGSGAIGGAIYLDNTQGEKQGFQANIGLKTGSFGLLGENLKISTSSEKLSASFRLAHQSSKNDFLFKNTAEIGQPLQRQQNAAFDKLNLTASLFFNLNKNNTLKIHAWDSRNDRQLAPTMTANNDKASLKDATSRLAIEYGHFKNQKHTKLRVAFFDEDNFYRSIVIDSSRNRAKTTIGEIEHNIDFNNKNALRFGVNFTKNTALSNNFSKTQSRNRLATFAAYQFEIVKTKFGITARQELIDTKLIPFTFSIGFEKPVFNQSPITQSLNHPFILRGSLSRNHNLPALNDLYWAQLVNPNLKAENGFSGELGMDFKTKQSKLSLTAFGMKTKDQIQWLPQPDGLWHPTNLNTVFSRGLEAFFSTSIEKGSVKYLLNTQYQLARSTDLNKKQLLYTPIHAGGATLKMLYKNVFFQYNQTASSRRYATTDNTLWTKPFTLGTITTGSDLKIGKVKTTLQVRILNIFNADYQVIPFYANARRQFLVEIKGRF